MWKAKGLLFSLSDDGVNAHHVPAFKLACQAGRSRGANHFAFDETRAMLCVAAKRRLILSHYNGQQFDTHKYIRCDMYASCRHSEAPVCKACCQGTGECMALSMHSMWMMMPRL